jgi:hypothetical protein
VRVDRKVELGTDGEARKHLPEARGSDRGLSLGHEHVAAGAVFPLEGPQRPHLLTAKLVHTGYAVLQASHVDEPMREVELIPGQGTQLGDAQAMPEGDQDHDGVAQAVPAPALLGGADQALHLLWCEVLARPNIPVAAPWRRYCPIKKSWAGLAGGLFP